VLVSNDGLCTPSGGLEIDISMLWKTSRSATTKDKNKKDIITTK
jgi:hypothetical protein